MSSSSAKCVRDRLLAIVDDIELIAKELLEIVLTPKALRPTTLVLDNNQLADLLVAKDKELKNELCAAKDQEEVHKSMVELRDEVDKHDQQIRQLQRNLREAEHILTTALFQAKHKLQLISKVTQQAIPSEELIRYAHKISAAHSVAAPYNWEIGDQRRPYPTDVDMRAGLLASANDPNITSNLLQQQSHQLNAYNANNSGGGAATGAQSNQQDIARPSSTASTSSSSSFAWGGGGGGHDIKPNISALSSYPHHPSLDGVKPSSKDVDDVEVMSTDSSSSSSSDSQ
ncbi:mediator of RNA polymerase II transcription subunit 4-like [Oppia nitens]|uniref:mediator of RNA polymerase II transcription subunit 4-like n=1 Tax=Oppia nitens TaxID=1686743 RepID=UPI0023DA1C68|nr:mediator of RNA polymerase II transcription subunit 4-like [Oppia nitens]